MNLAKYWTTQQEKLKNQISSNKLAVSALAVLLIGVAVGLNWPKNPSELAILEFLRRSPKEIKLPQIVLENKKTPDKSAGGLKVLSANLIGIYQEQKEEEASPSADNPQTPQLAGIRILGEIKNTGSKIVYEAKPIVKFFNEKKLIASKIAAFTENYRFLPLEPGQTNVYDVLVVNPPSSDSVTIEFETTDKKLSSKDKKSQVPSEKTPKLQNRSLEPVEVEQQDQKLTYYKLTGTLVNKASFEVVNPGLYVWIKNEKGKVIGLGAKVYDADLLPPDATLSAQLNIVPLTSDKMFDYQIKTFAEKL